MKGEILPEIDFEQINLPPCELKIIRSEGVYKIFDRLRKRYFIVTEEEIIRQLFVSWMIDILGYPPSLMNNEIGIILNGTKKRCDTVVFKSNGKPLMIVEYKSPKVKITQEVFDQIARYNMALEADLLVVSNGIQHYCCRMHYESKDYSFLESIPSYKTIDIN